MLCSTRADKRQHSLSGWVSVLKLKGGMQCKVSSSDIKISGICKVLLNETLEVYLSFQIHV